jgi:hypothetical protein
VKILLKEEFRQGIMAIKEKMKLKTRESRWLGGYRCKIDMLHGFLSLKAQ